MYSLSIFINYPRIHMYLLKPSSFIKHFLVLAIAAVTLPASAQNKISIKQYKAPANVAQVSKEDSFGAGFVSSSAAHVRNQASLCSDAEVPTVSAEKAYAHLVTGVGPSGWTYGTQNCWLFVNVAKSLGDAGADPDFYFFKGIDMLQKDGLLPNPLIEREMPGASQIASGGCVDHAVLSVRLHSLQ